MPVVNPAIASHDRLAECFFENEEIAELFSDEMGNLRVCFGFTSNYSGHLRIRNDRFFLYKS